METLMPRGARLEIIWGLTMIITTMLIAEEVEEQ
jgi:hypothetical protein